MSWPEVIAVFGPTASGKTAVAEALADTIGCEVVSVDSMQAYRGLPILTNQPTRPTLLVGIWPLSHEGSVGEFARLAHDAIDEVVSSCGTAVVVGGTGLYLRAALADLGLPPAPETEARRRWETAYDDDPDEAYARLVSADPGAATLVHPNDRRRVVRALELAEAGSSLVPEEDRLWTGDTRRTTLVVGLDVESDVLERRVVERTQQMFDGGVVAEVRAACSSGAVSRTAEKALGIREVVELEPEVAQEALARRTIQYAAYQRKWMRRIPGIVMIDADRPPIEVVDAILEVARAR